MFLPIFLTFFRMLHIVFSEVTLRVGKREAFAMAQWPYDPFRQLSQFRHEVDSIFQEFSSISRDYLFGSVRVDVYETADEVIATCDLPGIESKEDVQISIDNHMLHIKGTLKRSNQGKERHTHRQERVVGRFERAVSLPCAVSQDGISAVYKNGVLEVRMPKLADEQRKSIDIEFY